MAQTADISKTNAYQDKLLGLLGKRDPMEVWAATPGMLVEIVKSNSAETMRTRPYTGKWTPNEVIGHLVDAEMVMGYRTRMILSQDEPTILSMDQELWVAAQRYNQRQPAELVEQFRHLRDINLQLENQITSKDLERCGRHSERGLESLGLMRKMRAGHDLSHIDQITRYVAAIKAGTRAEVDRGPASL